MPNEWIMSGCTRWCLPGSPLPEGRRVPADFFDLFDFDLFEALPGDAPAPRLLFSVLSERLSSDWTVAYF